MGVTTPASESDEAHLTAIRAARAAREEANGLLRRLSVRAVHAQVPLRDIAEAAGVSHQTPANWAKLLEPPT